MDLALGTSNPVALEDRWRIAGGSPHTRSRGGRPPDVTMPAMSYRLRLAQSLR
jgi:hypothetical protein